MKCPFCHGTTEVDGGIRGEEDGGRRPPDPERLPAAVFERLMTELLDLRARNQALEGHIRDVGVAAGVRVKKAERAAAVLKGYRATAEELDSQLKTARAEIARLREELVEERRKQ